MKSLVVKHSIVIDGYKTSVSLEEAFWRALKDIARERRESLSHLIANIDQHRQFANLSSAIRLFVLGFYRDQFAQELSMAEQREKRCPGRPSIAYGGGPQGEFKTQGRRPLIPSRKETQAGPGAGKPSFVHSIDHETHSG